MNGNEQAVPRTAAQDGFLGGGARRRRPGLRRLRPGRLRHGGLHAAARPRASSAHSTRPAGALGSYALMGVLVGALAAGASATASAGGKHHARRPRLVLGRDGAHRDRRAVASFGLFRFLTGIGVGALVATVGALVAEFAPARQAQPLQRHGLLRHAGRRRARRPARDRAARRGGLARPVLDRRAAAALPAPMAVASSRVPGVAARPGPIRGGAEAPRASARPDLPPAAPRAGESRRRSGPNDRVRGAGHPALRAADFRCSADELRRAAAHLRAQHVASRDHEPAATARSTRWHSCWCSTSGRSSAGRRLGLGGPARRQTGHRDHFVLAG